MLPQERPALHPFAVSAADLVAEGWEDTTRGTGRWRTLVEGDRDASVGLVAGLAEFAPGETLNPHRHAPAEVYFGIEGSARVVIDGADYDLRPGVAVYIPPDAEHGVTAGPEGVRFFYTFPTSRFADVEYRFATNLPGAPTGL